MKYTFLFVHEKDAQTDEARYHAASHPVIFPDEGHPRYEEFVKKSIIAAKVKQLSEMPLTQLIRHFGVKIKPHQNSQVVKRLEINDL